jgi:NAD(P)-dependent dehydrogenase (short-subunit alcohol dehydrogenase family)
MTATLEGRRILVTGAATGIGAAAVEVFAGAGAVVAGVFHQTQPPERLLALATWRQADVRDQSAVNAVVDDAVAELGALDVLLHAAGLWRPSTPEGLVEDELDFLVATNVKGTVFCNQAAFAHMRRSGGRIVNLGSSEGVAGNPLAAHYSLTKAAVHSWTRAAARAWGRYGVTVNALAPAVETPGADRLREHLGTEGSAMLAEQLRSAIPIGGALGDPVTDLGPMLVFLAGEGSRFITGQLLAVDGGVMMVG